MASEAERRHYEEVFAKSITRPGSRWCAFHPETGEKALLLGQFVQRFVGQTHADSRRSMRCSRPM